MKYRKADFPISPLIIIILGLLFGVLAYLFISNVLPSGQREVLSIFREFL